MSEVKLVRGLDDIAPNNSDKAVRSKTIEPNKNGKEEDRPKMKSIVKGPVVKKKPSFSSKFKESFFGENDNIGDFVIYDVLVPALKNTLSDMGFGIVEMLFGRGTGRNYNSRVLRDGGRSYISYNDISRGRDDRRGVNDSDRARHDFGHLIYTSRGEAEDVLSHLVDLTVEYGEATVAALYELSGLESSHVDNRYGWTNLRDAYTERAQGGYIIHFPQVRPL